MNILRGRLFDTDRLLVRYCRMDDAQTLTKLMTPNISKWVASWPTPLKEEQTAEILAASLREASEGKIFPAVILQKESSIIIGFLKIQLVTESHRTSELGYWIGESFQNQGYAFEVAKGAIQFSFKELGAEYVIAGAHLKNQASLNLLAKLSMEPYAEQDVWSPARKGFDRCAYWRLATRSLPDAI